MKDKGSSPELFVQYEQENMCWGMGVLQDEEVRGGCILIYQVESQIIFEVKTKK